MGLNKEIWINDIRENFYPNDSFLADGADLNAFIENDKINLAEAGVDPTVVRNRSSYPIPAATRTDNPLEMALDDYSTNSTIIRDAETVELVYDKRASVIRGHQRSLRKSIGNYGLWAISADENTPATPVIKTTGDDDGTGRKLLTEADLALLSEKFDDQNYDEEGRVLVLPPSMFWKFIMSSQTLQNQYAFNSSRGVVGGEFVQFYGWTIRKRTDNPIYTLSTLEKNAFGSSYTAATHGYAATAYIKDVSFGAGLGTTKMFAKLADPDQQGDVINFSQRAVVLPFRQVALGAIIQDKV